MVAPSRSRTRAEYRRAIDAGLAQLNANDLVRLCVLHFVDVFDHVEDPSQNKLKILTAPLPLHVIWGEINAFLASTTLSLLEGEPPPEELHNRSGRTAIPEDLQSRSGQILLQQISSGSWGAAPRSLASSWSGSEITVEQPIAPGVSASVPVVAPGPISQPIPQYISASVPVVVPNQISQPIPQAVSASVPVVAPDPAAPPNRMSMTARLVTTNQTSRHVLIGFMVVWFSVLAVTIALAAVHVCGPIKRRLLRSLQEPQSSRNTLPAPISAPPEVPLVIAPAPPEVPPSSTLLATELPSAPPAELTTDPPKKKHRSHRDREAASEDPSAYVSLCQVGVPSWESGQLKMKQIATKLYLPRKFNPGSKKAHDWVYRQCKLIQKTHSVPAGG